MILHIKKLAIIQRDDPDNNSGDDTIVLLDNISEGAEGSSIFGITNEHGELKVNASEVYINSANPTIDVRVLNPTGDAYTGKTNVDQLKEWANELEDVYVVGLTVGGGVVFFGDRQSSSTARIVVNEQLSNNDVFAIKITSKSTFGFSTSTGIYQGGFWVGKNLLGIHEWGDSSGDGIANGWSASVFASESFSNQQQTLESDTSTGIFSKSIFFPFEGETVTFSIDVDTYPTGEDVARVEAVTVSPSGSVVTSQQDFNSTGRVSVSATVPSGNSALVFRVRQSGAAGNVTGVYSYPMVSLTGSTTYTKF